MKSWPTLMKADCRVIRINGDWIYPIFKNAYTSLIIMTQEQRLNSDIADCKNITIFLRDQEKRFVSGVGEFLFNNKDKDRDHLIDKIMAGEISDRHFCPQAYWLFHLFKFYKGKVNIQDVSQVVKYTPARLKMKEYESLNLKAPENYLCADRLLDKYVGQTISIGSIIEDIKHVLS